jgi:low temperature requirement protein LtrA
MVAGLIAVAVGNERVITHPHGHASAALSLLLCGGPILYLAAQGWYLWSAPGVFSHLRLIGSAVMVLVGLATLTAPPSVALLLVGATLWILAVLDRGGDAAAAPRNGSSQ